MTALVATAPAQPPAPVFARVTVHGASVLAARCGDEVRVPMKDFCATLGLPWDGQRQRINRDRLLKEAASMMLVPSPGGEQRQTALPLGVIPGFLVGLDERRFPPALQETIHAFRRECFEVLYRHFFGAGEQPAAAPAPAPAIATCAPGLADLPVLIAALDRDTRPGVRRMLYGAIELAGQAHGLPVPSFGELGFLDPADAMLDRLAEAQDVLTERRVKWNHALGRKRAFLLPELRRLFARADVDLPVDGDLRRALARSTASWRVTRRSVRSAITGRLVFAYVLEPAL